MDILPYSKADCALFDNVHQFISSSVQSWLQYGCLLILMQQRLMFINLHLCGLNVSALKLVGDENVSLFRT